MSGRFGRDPDLGLERADLELDVRRRGAADLDGNAPQPAGLESLQLGADGVRARRQIQEPVAAAGVRDRRARRHQGRARDLDGHAGQNLALVVGDESAQRSRRDLGGKRPRRSRDRRDRTRAMRTNLLRLIGPPYGIAVTEKPCKPSTFGSSRCSPPPAAGRKSPVRGSE